jgi:PAS domain S-box-containing protein
MWSAIKPSFRDSAPLSVRELNAIFDQSPIGLVYTDRELRVTRTNAALRRLLGQPDEALIGRRPAEIDDGVDGALVERIIAEQVLDRDVPVVEVPVEQIVAGERRVLSWSAYRIMDNGQVLGVLGAATDVTDRARAVMALRQANARLELLERAGSQVGTTLDIFRTSPSTCASRCCRATIRRAPAPARVPCGFAGLPCVTARPGPRFPARWAI